MTEKYLTISQTAALLQVCDETIRRYTRTGELKSSKLGRQIRITQEQLEDFLTRFDTADKEKPEDDVPEEERSCLSDDEVQETPTQDLIDGEYL